MIELFSSTNLFNGNHLWNVELHHVLNAILQCDCRTGAPSAGTHQLYFDNAVLEALIDDIPAVLLHRGPNGDGEEIGIFTAIQISRLLNGI